MPDESNRARLRQLASVQPERGRVLSVFLDLDPAEFATGEAKATAVTSVITDAKHQIEGDAGLEHDERRDLQGDLERVRETLQRGDLAADGAHGVAVFACGSAGLLELIRLPHAVATRVVLARTPFLEPLTVDDDERWTVLLANRRSARIFQGTADSLEETDRVDDDVHRQHSAGGWSQARYERSVEEEVRDHRDRVARVLFTAFKRRPFHHLLVGAPHDQLGDVEGALHPYLRDRLAGRLELDVENTSPEDVRAAAREAVEAHHTRREREALDRLEAGLGRGDRAAAGVDDVLGALDQARVEILLVGDAPQDVVERAVRKAIEQSATVMTVRRHDDLERHGELGAILRF